MFAGTSASFFPFFLVDFPPLLSVSVAIKGSLPAGFFIVVFFKVAIGSALDVPAPALVLVGLPIINELAAVFVPPIPTPTPLLPCGFMPLPPAPPPAFEMNITPDSAALLDVEPILALDGDP